MHDGQGRIRIMMKIKRGGGRRKMKKKEERRIISPRWGRNGSEGVGHGEKAANRDGGDAGSVCEVGECSSVGGPNSGCSSPATRVALLIPST
jgi:hypothetical protein